MFIERCLLMILLFSLARLIHAADDCAETCDTDYCAAHAGGNKTCGKLIRDACDCCTVCVRNENEICGGRWNVEGMCEDDLVCYRPESREQTGICVQACVKFQCLSIIDDNERTSCQCAPRRVPCNASLDDNAKHQCRNQSTPPQELERALHSLNDSIDCSKIICPTASVNASTCPADSRLLAGPTASPCCPSRPRCTCAPCPPTICGEHSIIQIYHTGNADQPGQCCDQFTCMKNSKQCYQDKKIYQENETWSIDQCTTCVCHDGLVDCSMVQCPTYTHCGYMYKPENECCPKCGGCLNDRFHVQHMNSTWIESNGCMRCWCENGRSRCIADGCIAPPCENPRQIANICCPVCDDDLDDDPSYMPINSLSAASHPKKCPDLDGCLLTCEHGLAKDEHGCLQCACSAISCPSPLCTLKFDPVSKPYCSCQSPTDRKCAPFNCEKHCPYSYILDKDTGCPTCACNPCPPLVCTKNCTYGLKRNEIGCPICVCDSNTTLNRDLVLPSWPRQCQSGSFSYSNGEIWFDGCRQCLCYKGESLCALISCPTPKCAQPVFLPNRCCPSCPGVPLLPEPIPSSQVCYASQYVTGEELEFDKCTKCICLHNIAFCTISMCPPLSCPAPIYDSSLCCPICPSTSDISAITDLASTDEDVCLLDTGLSKHAGEVWKQDDCQSCLCPRTGGGQVECYPQTCNQQLPCANPVLKKGQCCPFCLPPTAAIAVCVFNYVQYRSGEHWNVSECHHCNCILGTIVCHQHKCPSLTCVHTVTLAGHCCPICRDQLPFVHDQDKLSISSTRLGFSVIIIFSILILILLAVILILIFVLLRGGRRSRSSPNQIADLSYPSPVLSHQPSTAQSKQSNLSSYKYNLMLVSHDAAHRKPTLSTSSQLPVSSLERISTHSMIGTNTTGTNSSSHELEPTTWTDDDGPILASSVSSNDGDDEQEIISSDYEDAHPRTRMLTGGTSTIIYV